MQVCQCKREGRCSLGAACAYGVTDTDRSPTAHGTASRGSNCLLGYTLAVSAGFTLLPV